MFTSSVQPWTTTVPFSELSVSAGGLHHDQLVVKWVEAGEDRQVFLRDPILITAFRQSAPSDLTRELELTATAVRNMRKRQRMIWAVTAGIIGAIALLLWFGSDLLVEAAVDRIPVDWEHKLGDTAYRDFLAQHTVVKDGHAVAAVTEIAKRLTEQIPHSPYKFEVTVVKSDVVNAFALPGGYIVVFTGLLSKAESGEEVAGVLGHEINHVLLRHGLNRIVKQLGVVAATIVMGDQQGLAGLMKQLGVELFTLKFGRAQETEADVAGLRLLHRARIDPNGMIRFFERLAEQEKGRVEILSTHPMSDGRAARLKAETAALPRQASDPFSFDWKAVQASP
ncbi:M48 family metallopeptidase [Nitrospira sp. KM1]|uniref:M48 family metallopeptidase n=1 Tax=Nitrospira sp. KM1 TaxID=1936990 RepID=UPI0015664993|nr:M48 family metallopeptidase [Nitrospira sp. KM1]